jgi:hypothetical protein
MILSNYSICLQDSWGTQDNYDHGPDLSVIPRAVGGMVGANSCSMIQSEYGFFIA